MKHPSPPQPFTPAQPLNPASPQSPAPPATPPAPSTALSPQHWGAGGAAPVPAEEKAYPCDRRLRSADATARQALSPASKPSAGAAPQSGNRAAAPQSIPHYREWLECACPDLEWHPPHLQLIQRALDQVTAGATRRLMLFLPPRHGKSELVTVRYPVYRLEQNPRLRVIIGAYNQHLAERFSRKGRRIARQRFALSTECSAAGDWETLEGGGLRAAGVGTGVTGLGADLILIDDPVKSREEAESRAYRERVWEWYTDDLYTRQEPKASIILIMTRWHEDDLAGRILRSEAGRDWKVIRLPALAETPEEYRHWATHLYGSSQQDTAVPSGTNTPGPASSSPSPSTLPAAAATAESAKMERGSGGEATEAGLAAQPITPPLHHSNTPSQDQDPLGRKPGTALWPERFNEAALARIQQVLGPSFSALYQGRPKPAKSGHFQREWFKIVDHAPAGLTWVRFWDTAAKAGQQHDYWAGALLARASDGTWYLQNLIRGRWDYPRAKQIVLQTAASDGPHVLIGIEDSASGTALLQDLRRDPQAGGHRFWPLPVQADKAVRAGAWASLAHGGLVHLVAGAWIAPFLEEVEQFPLGAHDDQVDAVSGAYELTLRRLKSAANLPVFSVGPPRRAC